jgi:hypothetical protein
MGGNKRKSVNERNGSSRKQAVSSPAVDMASEPAFGLFSANDYAIAVFGDAVSCQDLTADPEQPRKHGIEAKDPADSMAWENGCQRVNQKLALFNIEADICRKRFHATNFGDRMINPPRKAANNGVRFFCTKCMERKIASLVAVGVFMTDEKGPKYLKMNFLFPHNSNCDSDKQHAVQPPYTVVDFDFKTVIGSTYDDVLGEVCKQEVGSKTLIGTLIDFDVKRHDTDDRRYFPLPFSKASSIDHERSKASSIDHERCMTRLLLHLSVKLNFVEESVAEFFDMDAVESGINNTANCHRQWTNYPVRVNEGAHLFLSEISLLFGGHNLKKNGPVQHQRCHVDVNGLEGNSALDGKTKPGSLILPLEDFRSIFIGSGLIKLLKGQYIFFNGDVAHRGCTYNELSWHPAIHLHLDTRLHRRKAGVVEFTDDKEDEAMERLRYHLDCVQRIMAEAFANGWKKVLALGNKTGTK